MAEDKADVPVSESAWRKKLSIEQYKVLREKATELPFTGKLLHNNKRGVYKCAGCGSDLFSSDTKFDSNTGWPSFDSAVQENIKVKLDFSHGMMRKEVVCAKCGGHLGHVFLDSRPKTGKRYCINSCSLDFREEN